jgi:hypothetical protein
MAHASGRAMWWVDAAPASHMGQAELDILALSTLGVMTTQIIPIRTLHAAMVGKYEALALQLLRVVSPIKTPRLGVIADWIGEGVNEFRHTSAIRLDVGFSFASGPSDPNPTLIGIIAQASESPIASSEAVHLTLASHPTVTFPPFAGLPLTLSAERGALVRSSRASGATEVLLYDLDGRVIDLAESTLVLGLPEGLSTPSSAHGAIRTPLRDRLVSVGVLNEVSIPAEPHPAVPHFLLTRWGSVMPVSRIDDRELPRDESAFGSLTGAVEEALAS